MKIKCKSYLFIYFAFLLLLVLNTICFAQEYKEITVVGTSEIAGGNEDDAKKLAIRDALRNAVEMGVGVVIQSKTDVRDFEVIKDEIKSNAEGFVKEYDIVKEGARDGRFSVTLRAKVMTERISEAFKKRLDKASAALGQPSITFVLTTWRKIGETGGSYTQTEQVDVTAPKSGSSAYRLSEAEWKKYPDMTIIDSFNQEFKEKGFDLKATDEARKTAVAASIAQAGIDVFDREQVRKKAEKEGANFVARGEVQIIDSQISESTGNYEVRSKVGIEIIDVNSGDIVSAYSNTTKASSRSREDADAQSVKNIAILAARTLAGQTLETWEKRASIGQYFTIEVRNISHIRKQQRPLLKAVESIASIRQQTNPSQDVLRLEVSYKGNKTKLGETIVDKIENVPGFSVNEFDGPIIEGGKIVFKFVK